MKIFSWMKRIKEARDEFEPKEFLEKEALVNLPRKEEQIPWSIASDDFTAKYVSNMNLHYRNSCSNDNFVKCYKACIEDAISHRKLNLKEKKERILEVIITTTENLYRRMTVETNYLASNVLDDFNDRRLITDFQKEMLSAIYMVCDEYHVSFSHVFYEVSEYEATEIDDSNCIYECIHPIIRMPMQVLLSIPSYFEEDEEAHEEAVLAVQRELVAHFNFLMEELLIGDITSLKRFMEKEGYLLTIDFSKELSHYFNLCARDIRDYFYSSEVISELVMNFPEKAIEIYDYALEVLLVSETSYQNYLEKDTAIVAKETLIDILQAMADFKEYEAVPFGFSVEEWKELIRDVMYHFDGDALNYVSQLLIHSFGIKQKAVEGFIAFVVKEGLEEYEVAELSEERVGLYQYFTFLLTNDIVYQVIAKEKPSLID